MKHRFGVEKTETNECVFETYDGTNKEHIGWGKENVKNINKDDIKLIIKTNFWPDNVKCEWFRAEIFINNVLLRPLSQCYDKGDVSIPSYTILKKHDNFDWESFLEEICDICNHYEVWLNYELEKLINKLPIESAELTQQLCILKMLREYDCINTLLFTKKYREHYDDIIFKFENVNPLFKKVFDSNDITVVESFDVLWNYIKDYRLSLI